MNYEDFTHEVKKLVTPSDYQKDFHLLFTVKQCNYDVFLKFLVMGATIKNAIGATGIIFKIAQDTPLTQEQAMELYPVYSRIIYFVRRDSL